MENPEPVRKRWARVDVIDAYIFAKTYVRGQSVKRMISIRILVVEMDETLVLESSAGIILSYQELWVLGGKRVGVAGINLEREEVGTCQFMR